MCLRTHNLVFIFFLKKKAYGDDSVNDNANEFLGAFRAFVSEHVWKSKNKNKNQKTKKKKNDLKF